MQICSNLDESNGFTQIITKDGKTKSKFHGFAKCIFLFLSSDDDVSEYLLLKKAIYLTESNGSSNTYTPLGLETLHLLACEAFVTRLRLFKKGKKSYHKPVMSL